MAEGGKSILLVEDEDNIALALEFLLQREGHRVRRVATGPEAMPAVLEDRPDLVVLDVMLPGISGYEICQQIRADQSLSELRVLMMTARGNTIERRKGLALGADGFVAKPFPLDEFLGAVRQLLALSPVT